ncbi:hypothetical protein DL96DRAFT_1009556 [Flagelloscypha sp. PMI_526]|nr:hypothetical protein DL96DRAFT_1009556 [Flagelloscypha sp. PMI_526]
MLTPYPGTIQQPDIDSIYPPTKTRGKFNLRLIVQLVEISAGSCAHTVTCCALGRFMLDHFHLWHSRWIIPPNAPNIEKHAELIAAFMAGCLTGPAIYGAVVGASFFFSELRSRFPRLRARLRFRIPYPFSDSPIWILYFFVLWTLLAVTGAILHPRFQYLTVGSVLAVYGFGSLLLFPPSFSLTLYIIYNGYLISDRVYR